MVCLLIADDLTGACDAAVHFALRGYRTSVALAANAPVCDVLAVSTESRDLDERAIAAAMRRVAELGPARIVIKKIDSTLRGNPSAEVCAAMDAFEYDRALVTPALPAMGRIVRNGMLSVACDPEFTPIDAAARVGLPVEDAVSDDDLDRIVAANGGDRVLWAGSAGLAGAIARSLPPGLHSAAAPARGGVTFCIGSDHKVTVAQMEALGDEQVTRIPRDCDPALVRASVTKSNGPIFVCGGDTASLVCRALEVHHIDLIDEVIPGVPRGIVRGGLADGRTMITKSGGFGAPDALLHVARCHS